MQDEFLSNYWNKEKVVEPIEKETAYTPLDPWFVDAGRYTLWPYIATNSAVFCPYRIEIINVLDKSFEFCLKGGTHIAM